MERDVVPTRFPLQQKGIRVVFDNRWEIEHYIHINAENQTNIRLDDIKYGVCLGRWFSDSNLDGNGIRWDITAMRDMFDNYETNRVNYWNDPEDQIPNYVWFELFMRILGEVKPV